MADAEDVDCLKCLRSNDDSVGSVTIFLPTHCSRPFVYHGGKWGDNWGSAIGECIGRHQHLKWLSIMFQEPPFDVSRENSEALMLGLSKNRSIEVLTITGQETTVRASVIDYLSPFLVHNHNLQVIYFSNEGEPVGLEPGAIDLFSSALSECNMSSLSHVNLSGNGIGGESASKLVKSLNTVPDLETLDLSSNNIGSKECEGLADLLLKPNSKLKHLCIDSNRIGDDGIPFLAVALAGNNILTSLNVRNNRITGMGWRIFFRALQSSNNRLDTLEFDSVVSDEVMTMLARALTSNHHLKVLSFGTRPQISDNGWEMLIQAVCNTSSINETYLSNHTLVRVCDTYSIRTPSGELMRRNNTRKQLAGFLRMNQRHNKRKNKARARVVARKKILAYHFKEEFSMTPFDEGNMNFRTLPHVLAWIGKYGKHSNVQSFSAMFGFLRKKPCLCDVSCPSRSHESSASRNHACKRKRGS